MNEQLPTKIEPVVTGKTSVKQKNILQRAGEALFAQTDPNTVSGYVIKDIVIPKFRSIIYDIVTSALEMFLYGGSTPTNRASSNNSYRNYNGAYTFKPNGPAPKSPTVTGMDIFQFQKIMFQSKRDAMAVLDTMTELLERYSLVTVAQFYSLANYNVDNVQANKFGWFDLSSAEVVRDYDGEFYIKLPKASPID